MTHILRYSFLMIVLALAAEPAPAQVATGTPPFGTFASNSAPDVINVANLNAHLAIPVLHKAGRGTDFTFDLSYDSSVWFPVTSGSTTSWQPVVNWGWRGVPEIYFGYISNKETIVSSGYANACHTYTWSNWVYHDAWGVPHPFAGESDHYTGSYRYCGDSYYDGLNSLATDGSGYSLVVNAPAVSIGTLYFYNGRVINPNSGSTNSTDRNGNQITTDGSGHFYDTLSSTTPVLTVSGTGTPSDPTVFTYTAPSGASPAYKMNYTNYTVATNFGITGTSEFKSPAAVPLVTSVVLPDGSQYTIQYEATPSTPSSGACTPYSGTTCVTARISWITLPTGGSIHYTYTGGNNGVFADGSTAGLTRALSDGVSWSATWLYSRTQGSGAASTDTITDPLNNATVMQFQGIYETQRVVNQGSSSALETVNTCYNGAASPCTGTAVSLPISSRTMTTILPGSANLQSKVATSYNSYGQLTEEDDYDYGTGAPASTPSRKEIITILTVGTDQAIQTSQIQDGSGNVLAQTQMTFDENTPTPTSGTLQHQNPSGGRGNPTTISYLVHGSTSLTKHLTYFDTGNVASITDVNGAVTTYKYPDATSTCSNAFPTEVDEAVSGLKQLFTWNCTGSVATSSTDENQKLVSTTYADANFWRPAYTRDQLGNQTNFTYTGQTQVESGLNFNGTTSTSDRLVTIDGLGRPHIFQTKQSQTSSSYDSVEIDYDAVGRQYKTTTLYSASTGQLCSGTCPGTTTTYDGLGRPLTVTDVGSGTVTNSYSQNDILVTLGPKPTGENSTKSRQLEYDGLGRLASVCELTSVLPGNGTCGQNTSKTGYWTKYTYDANGNLINVTQNAQSGGAQQTRTYAYDDLSRTTSETNPETGNATVYYFFDSDPGTKGSANCSGPYNGDLVKIVDVAGNVICNTYDAVHRNTSTTYPAGPNSSVTPTSHFVYDSATVNGSVMNNAKTRLAEAYTTSSSCTSNCTDFGFSYTARGEVSDVYESAQHSGGYYHVSGSYWASGALNQLNSASCNSQPCLTGLPAFTYGADGEGRANTINASTGQSPVSGSTYNLYSSPPQAIVNLGSGDSDVFNLDANTGRTTQYKFNVGSQSMIGVLTWNANGSLGSLAITDPFNSGGTQTCTYVHDDLERIGGSSTTAGVNCVNGSQQTVWQNFFTYDTFGNINKSGTSSFNASYNSATNRMTTVGSCTPTYDDNGASGNVTNDCLNTYTWDANGRPVTINGVIATYDALGRMVELNRSGAYSEVVYDPTGNKLALMSGQTLSKAFVPLTGGATAIYTSSGLDHYRHSDWLGSARLMTSQTRTVLGDVAYSPFGETYAQSGIADFSFTGMNTDADPANPALVYDFPAREYGIQGRWPSPDPAGPAAVDPANPQSWNRYAYALNNPLAMTDPSGLCPERIVKEEGGCSDGWDWAWDCWTCFGWLGWNWAYGWDPYGSIDAGPEKTPQAPPAPSGGYGAGIDPFGNSFMPGEVLGWPNWLACRHDIIPCDPFAGRYKISTTVWVPNGHVWFQPSPASAPTAPPPITDELMLSTLAVAGMEASHDLGCAVSGLAGQVPFVGHALGGSLAGQFASGIDETGIVASHSGDLTSGISRYATTMREMGAGPADVRGFATAAGQIAKYGPAVEKAAGLLKGGTFVVGTAATIYDFNKRVSGR